MRKLAAIAALILASAQQHNVPARTSRAVSGQVSHVEQTLPVAWTGAVGATATGSTLTGDGATGAWGDSGAVSTKAIASGDGFLRFTVSETAKLRIVGLSRGNADEEIDDIDFGVMITDAPDSGVYESGVSVQAATFTTGDVVQVEVVGGVVKYRKNGAVIYTSAVSPAYPLLVDASIYDTNATISGTTISGRLVDSGY